VSFRGNIDVQIRGFYYAASGNNSFSGETLEVPKLTIQAAIDEATNLIPAPSGSDLALVTAAQGGSFTDGFILTDFVQLNGQDTTIAATQTVAAIMASGLRCRMENVSNFQASSTVFMISGLSDVGIFSARIGASGAGTKGVTIAGTVTNIFIDSSDLVIDGVGATGLEITSTNTNPVDINIDIGSLAANNTTFMDYNPATAASECVVHVSSIDMGVFTGTTAFLVQAGILIIESAGDIRADTFMTVKSGAKVRITSNHTVGSIIVESGGLLQMIGVLVDGTITIDAGGTMEADIISHTGTLTINGTLKGQINSTFYGDKAFSAATTAASFNGIALTTGGVSTNFLDETGNYSVPAAGGQVDSVVSGINITIDATDPVNPIANLDADITSTSVNGVSLTTAGVATNFLNETGNYSAPSTGGSLQDAYDNGQSITTTTALGPVVLTNTGSTRAAFTITPGTIPTTSLVSGQIYSDGNDLYIFDSVRAKFLSSSERFGFGLNGAADNEYMRVGHASDTNAAWIVPYDATITHITAFVTSGLATKGFEIQDESGSVLVSFSLVASEFDATQNVDISAGEHLRAFIVAAGGSVSNSAVSVFVRRRV